jgi:hypothetical protein
MLLAALILAGAALLGWLWSGYISFGDRPAAVDRWRRQQALRERARRIYR